MTTGTLRTEREPMLVTTTWDGLPAPLARAALEAQTLSSLPVKIVITGDGIAGVAAEILRDGTGLDGAAAHERASRILADALSPGTDGTDGAVDDGSDDSAVTDVEAAIASLGWRCDSIDADPGSKTWRVSPDLPGLRGGVRVELTPTGFIRTSAAAVRVGSGSAGSTVPATSQAAVERAACEVNARLRLARIGVSPVSDGGLRVSIEAIVPATGPVGEHLRHAAAALGFAREQIEKPLRALAAEPVARLFLELRGISLQTQPRPDAAVNQPATA